MSPARPSSGSRRNSSTGFKPYARGAIPMVISRSMPDGSSDKSSPASARSTDSSPNRSFGSATSDLNHLERPGFPTYDQYKRVEASYLQSLTPRRQGKALISQSMFDRIWDVLHEPETPGETAQFRFWARKMFTVSKTHHDLPQEVLLHDGLLVAIQEQLYDLLCYCHGSTGHGGRDKTCALIRKHYTWVPKDLVSSFIKACPTCIMKKCGNVDSAAALKIAQATASAPRPMRKSVSAPAYERMPTLPAVPDIFQPGVFHPCDTILDHPHSHSGGDPPPSRSSGNVLPWPPAGGPVDSPTSQSNLLSDDPLEAAYREAVLRARGIKALSGFTTNTPPKGLHGQSMSREVSLYNGLPNGWQYRHEDYASAYAEFMRTKDLAVIEENSNASLDPNFHVRRPRVPSIVPLWSPEQFSQMQFESPSSTAESGVVEAENSALPQLMDARLGLGQFNDLGRQQEGYTNKETMQYLLMASQAQHKEVMDEAAILSQIDPLLFPFCAPHPSPQLADEEGRNRDAEEAANPHTNTLSPPRIFTKASTPPNTLTSAAPYFSSSASMKRAAVPPRLNLDFPSERTFQALLAYRDSLGDGNLTPDSPLANMSSDVAGGQRWYPGNPSPTSSESSCGSQLSAFPVRGEIGDDSALTTPANSAVTTPVDECGMSGDGSGQGAGVGSATTSAIEHVKGKGAKVEEQEIESVVCAL
ncbi:hypothetical protein CPB84DRAFT_1772641 [Gymnopilus junonius]|uniref:Integrase zinc-binding domain-containing protein n=1 Tax=Gymnopilus junonius TaxID=109634 RepID=A0A9P5NTH8_GYMJU|nr:hypothetical protein CPB84DRAFT_1772641 [Gymnopilus junonius]